jgi:hypothetical protein
MNESLEVTETDFNLPNHNNELSKAGDIIEKLKNRIHITINVVELVTDKEFVRVYEEVVTALDFVGRLSMPAFAVEDEMEEHFKLKYLHSPELGKQLWLDKYENVHRPYTILKNRCFKLLDEWDAYYKALYEKDPPNWKP